MCDGELYAEVEGAGERGPVVDDGRLLAVRYRDGGFSGPVVMGDFDQLGEEALARRFRAGEDDAPIGDEHRALVDGSGYRLPLDVMTAYCATR